MTDRHVAYNTLTGEVIITQHGRQLKKLVAREGGAGWVFSHKGLESLVNKIRK